MADIRINALPTTATDFASDDYIAIDGTTNGTRKLNAKTASLTLNDVILGSSGPSVKSSLDARAARQGLVFDGTNGASFSAISVFGTGDFTVSAWVKFSALSGNQPIFGGASNSFWLYLNTSVLAVGKVNVSDGTGYSSALVAGKTYHVSYVRSGGTGTYYVNGVADGTSVETGINYSVGLTEVGSSHGNYFKTTGNVSGAFVYNRALSSSEVVALYESGAPAGSDYNNASYTSTVTGDSSTFTSGVGSWSAWGAGTITASAGVGNVTSGATTDNGDYLAAQLPQSPAAFTNLNKRYRITLTLGSVTGGTVIVRNLVASGTRYATGLTSGTHIIDTGLITSQQNFGLAASAAGVTFTVDNITVVPLGLLLAPDAAQAGGGLAWYDTSGNNATITLPASGVSWNVPSSQKTASGWRFQNGADAGSSVPSTFGLISSGTDGANIIAAADGNMTLTLNTRSTQGYGSLNTYNYGTSSAFPLVVQGNGGNLLLGTTTDSSNGKLQLATHTTSAGGIGFGTALSLFTITSNALRLSAASGGASFQVTQGGAGTVEILTNGTDGYYSTQGSAYFRTNTNVTALTLDSSQRCILAGALRLNNAYTAGAPTATGYVTIQDSAGNTYKVLVGT